ncbi:MAG: tryptophan 7-halogenase [Acidobacteria bacterium]|nr:tryptophan 7-halogenase [Acidobacteriota bacterium]
MTLSRADCLVIGGGPAGATAARQLALQGLDVVVLEKDRHPRFHVGESFLPRSLAQLRELGLEDRLERLPRVQKLGAEFLEGHAGSEPSRIWFRDALGGGEPEAFNIARAPFDAMLLDAAREAGATVREDTPVREILELADGAVRVATADGEVAARYLLDASGQGTILGRHLGTRRVLPALKKVAYFGHFRGVGRAEDETGGFISLVLCREGWFWLIPLDEETTSIGLVLHHGDARQLPVPASQILGWAVRRCPVMAERCADAVFPESNGVTADFSYTCAPYAGPGYFLLGDAATFLDPIFSTGVCLGMMGAVEAAEHVAALVRGTGADAAARQQDYSRFVERSSRPFFRLVEGFYQQSFRELLLSESGPLEVHRALVAVLAGHVFPRPAFALRWRLRLFELFVRLQKRFELAPHREPFSLFDEAASADSAAA